jgi:NitT/TauT family transport system substrate-binding protein
MQPMTRRGAARRNPDGERGAARRNPDGERGAARRNRRRTMRISVALVAIVALFAAACGSDDSSDAGGDTGATTTVASSGTSAPDDGVGPAPQPLAERTPATIALVFNIETFAPALLAEHFGEFEKENLDVTLVNVPSNEGTVMVASGQAQLKMSGISAAFYNAVQSGVDVVWLANVHQNSEDSKEGVWMRNEFYDTNGNVIPEKLVGADIATGSSGIGSPSTYAVNAFLEDNGVSLDQINAISLSGSDLLVAVENGSVDGGYVLTPQWLQLEAGDDAQYAGMYGGFDGAGFSASTYEMSRSFIEDEPEVAQAIMRAIVRTVRTYLQGDYHSDPEVLAALAEVTGSPADAIASSPSLVFNPDLPLNGQMMEDIQTMWLESAPDTLNYDTPIPVDEITDRSIIEAILAED